MFAEDDDDFSYGGGRPAAAAVRGGGDGDKGDDGYNRRFRRGSGDAGVLPGNNNNMPRSSRFSDEEPPPLYSILRGKVVSVQDYGAFVAMDGYQKQGMVHVSQLSNAHADTAKGIVDIGERVYVKVMSVSEDGKISLSMKFVNQGSGDDLDPNRVNYEQDLKKTKTFKQHEKVSFDHLMDPLYAMQRKDAIAKSIVSSAQKAFGVGDKSYDLIPEDDDFAGVIPTWEPPKELKKKHKDKKEKKAKTKNAHKHRTESSSSGGGSSSSSDSSSDSDSEGDSKKRGHHHHHDKKSKKSKKDKKKHKHKKSSGKAEKK